MNEKPFGVRGTTIRVVSGTYLDLLDPHPDQFKFSDIAGALSRICRYGGQIPAFYSVAEHSLCCADQARADSLYHATEAAVLMHDAAEAFVGDMVKPLKCLFPYFEAIEARIERCIGLKFGIDFAATQAAVKKIDREMLIAEKRALLGNPSEQWTGEEGVRVLTVNFRGYSPFSAERMFNLRATELGIDINI